MRDFVLDDIEGTGENLVISDEFGVVDHPFSIGITIRSDDPIFISPDEAVEMAENLLRRARKHREISG